MNRSIKTVVVALAVTIALTLSGCASDTNNVETSTIAPPTLASDASVTPKPTPGSLTADQMAVIDSVTLKKNAALYECPANLQDPKTGLLSIDDYSELGARSNSFAFNVPLPSGTAAEKFTSWQAFNCTNELQGVTYAWVLANTLVYGTLVGNIPGNEVLQPLVGLTESDLRTYMMDTFLPVLASKPDPDAVQKYVTGTMAYETFITQVNTLYEQLYVIDDAAHVSYINWEVSGPSLGYPDVVKSNVGDDLPAVTLAIIEKGVCQPVAAILINNQDQRPERANLPGCVTPPSTTPPTTPNCTVGCTPRVPPCTGWPICEKIPSGDPQVQGHNHTGGQGLNPVQSDGLNPPARGTPSPVYTGSTTPSSGIPVGSTPTATTTTGTDQSGGGLH